jgi:hypothetical protein
MNAPPLRRVFRFSLRGLFVGVTILAIWLGVISHRARQERAAIHELTQAGASFLFDDQYDDHRRWFTTWLHGVVGGEFFRTVRTVGYGGAPRPLVDDDLMPLYKLTTLTGLYIDPLLGDGDYKGHKGFEPRCGSFTKQGLSELGKLTSLTYLEVVSKEIDDDILLAWQSLVNLETLRLGTPSLTPDAILRFQEAVPQCKVEVDKSAVFGW